MLSFRNTLIALAVVLLGACSGDNTIVGEGGTGTGGTGGTGGGGGGTTVPSAAVITATSSSTSIPSDGSSNATITAYVRDANNSLIAGVPVAFTASSGGISGATAVTGADGTATAELLTAGDSSLRTITVTATAGSLETTVDVQVVATTGTASVQMGSGSGSAFAPGMIDIATTDLSAGGSTSLSISLVYSDGTLYTGNATIGFNSPCVATGTSEMRQNGVPVSTVQTSTGIATVTYVAQGCSGSDVITATTVVEGQNLSASGTVTVAAAAVGSIEFLSATPNNIALEGTGDPSRPETSTVVFRVRDASNGPVSGASVAFSLNTSVGGIGLSTTTATSDSQGLVQTIVQAGTVATSVRVTATVTSVSPTIATQSSQLSVTTGIPTDNSFSLAVECFNIEGLNVDGVTTTVTARLGDRFQNPVPDGTAVTFTAEGGNILSQCTTQTNATEGGVCAVEFRSSNPRPADGRITIFAKAIGEESFTDSNGNGAFDVGESFFDIEEPFRDDDEDGTFTSGEEFYDFDSSFDRNAADGVFNGVLCNDPARCDPAKQSAGIGENNLIILSGSSPVVTLANGAALPANLVIAADSAQGISFWVRDVNDNPMPAGTTISLSASGGGFSVVAPNSFTVPCTAISAGVAFPGLTTFSFTITASPTATSAVITLETVTPGGITTITQIPVSSM